MILHRYFARRFFVAFAALFTLFLLFIILIDLIEQVRIFEGAPFGDVLVMATLHSPQTLYQMLPLITILATIMLFLGLARSSELVVTRAAGRSGLSAVVAPVTVAALLGVTSLATFNPIVAATSTRYSELRELYESGGQATLSVGADGLWLRQGDARSQTVIHARRSSPDAGVLYDATFTVFAENGGPIRRIVAQEARLAPEEWVLIDAKVWPLIAGINPELNAAFHDELRLETTLTSERIRDSFGKVTAIPVWDLPDFIAQLEEAGFSARRHAVWLQMELARPLFLVAMVLLGAAFTMRPARSGRTGLAVLASVLLGFALYYIRNFAQILGENGQIPMIMAAWVPPGASVMLALGLILFMEDG